MPLDAAPDSKPQIVHSACPHDCPSTCALEVERLSPTRIGRVHGAKGNPYTAGVICAKVARYAERQHHPDRLAQPLKRVGDKGVGRSAFAPISWEQALDETAERFIEAEQRWGRKRCGRISMPAPWGWCSGTASTACATKRDTRSRRARSASRCPIRAGWQEWA